MAREIVRGQPDRGRAPTAEPASSAGPAGKVPTAVLMLQRNLGNRATAQLLQRNGGKKKIKNPRLREAFAQMEETLTLPTERQGSKKKSQRVKHRQEYEEEMRRFARKILIDSEGNVNVGGHGKQRHGGASDEFLMGRRIPVASTFDTPADQERAVAALLIENRNELQAWRDDSDDAEFGLTIDRPDDVHVRAFERIGGIGPGFNKLSEDRFPYMKAFFRKNDMSAMNPWGLITCYPSGEQ